MLRLRCSLLLTLAVAAALVPVSSASAATSAQRFADAVERGKSAMRAKQGEFKAAAEAIDFEGCEKALVDDPPPDREMDRFLAFLVAALLQPMVEPSLPVLKQIVADLDAIPTQDPILRSGRAAWRESVAVFTRIPKVGPDACDQLVAWAKSGWKASKRPDFDFAALDKLLEDDTTDTTDAKLERAARRMRQLGVSKGDAKRFTGDSLFDDVEDEMDSSSFGEDDDEDTFGGSSVFRIDVAFGGDE